jgi:hypothetical protein
MVVGSALGKDYRITPPALKNGFLHLFIFFEVLRGPNRSARDWPIENPFKDFQDISKVGRKELYIFVNFEL